MFGVALALEVPRVGQDARIAHENSPLKSIFTIWDFGFSQVTFSAGRSLRLLPAACPPAGSDFRTQAFSVSYINKGQPNQTS